MVRPRAKVTIDSLYEVIHEKSIGTKINDLDICLEVVSGHVCTGLSPDYIGCYENLRTLYLVAAR